MRPRDCPEGQFVVTLRNEIGAAGVPRSAAASRRTTRSLVSSTRVPRCDGLRNPRGTGTAAITCAVLVGGIVHTQADRCRAENESLSSPGQRIRCRRNVGPRLPRAVRLNSGGGSLGAIQSRSARVCADAERRRRADGHLYWMLNTPVTICDSYGLADPMLRTRT